MDLDLLRIWRRGVNGNIDLNLLRIWRRGVNGFKNGGSLGCECKSFYIPCVHLTSLEPDRESREVANDLRYRSMHS